MSETTAGQWYSKRGFDFRVDFVSQSEVYFARFREGETRGALGRVSKEVWESEIVGAELFESQS